MKIHYNNALNPNKHIVFACSIGGRMIPATTDPALVTCGNCKKRMGKLKKPSKPPVPAIVVWDGEKLVKWK